MTVWIVYEDGGTNDVVFSTPKKAYDYIVEIMEEMISEYNEADRPDMKREYEEMLDELKKEYNECDEEFG